MIEDELIKIWQSSPNQERVKFERSRLMIEVHSSLNSLHKEVKYHDLMNTLATWIIVPVFTFYIYFVPFTLSKIACAFIAAWAVYIMFLTRKAKKNKPKRLTGTYLEYLHSNRQFLLDQKQLLGTVLYWAIIPFIVSVTLFFVGFLERPGASVTRTVVLCGGNIVFGAFVYVLNKWAVKKTIVPRLEKVDQLINELEKS